MLMHLRMIHKSSKHKLSYANAATERPACDCEEKYSH